MTAKIIFASNKLENINDQQIKQMVDKQGLGQFISAQRTAQGAMGQTMYVCTTKGDYVLKGNPLYEGQLKEEKYFIEQLHKHTDIPVPVPYILDESEDIFGWNYAIMPRLSGYHLTDKQLYEKLPYEEKIKIAERIAHTLTAFHQWRVRDCGELNPLTCSITPFQEGYQAWLYKRIYFWLQDATKYSLILPKDIAWVQHILDTSQSAFAAFSSPCFVMGDFKPGNFLVDHTETEGWKVSGVFDFTNAYFGDPLSDLIKLVTLYIDKEEESIALHLMKTYINGCMHSYEKTEIKQRLMVHMLHQRILDWGCAKAINKVDWDNDLAFFIWASRYTEKVADFVDKIDNPSCLHQ
ncbi:aminoglycoside phosphotransferase family protein [Virgibacillus sp. LDC-1]|uniref:phosphotransferase family protein n=1 Tax=Virgibacillus sp. LDC-1 TaxID=3039856 RepID=UPI0024DEDC09|nr:aminoglycoside phosphotransferase family protein [Virgibacillus sp. LDC-1]